MAWALLVLFQRDGEEGVCVLGLRSWISPRGPGKLSVMTGGLYSGLATHLAPGMCGCEDQSMLLPDLGFPSTVPSQCAAWGGRQDPHPLASALCCSHTPVPGTQATSAWPYGHTRSCAPGFLGPRPWVCGIGRTHLWPSCGDPGVGRCRPDRHVALILEAGAPWGDRLMGVLSFPPVHT